MKRFNLACLLLIVPFLSFCAKYDPERIKSRLAATPDAFLCKLAIENLQYVDGISQRYYYNEINKRNLDCSEYVKSSMPSNVDMDLNIDN